MATAVSAAAAGSVVCLADGSYGELDLVGTKAGSGVVVRAANPGEATIAGASLQGSNVTLAQFNVNGEIDLMPGSSGMVVDHNRITGGYMGVNMPSSSTEIDDARITGNRFVGPFGEDAIRANRYHDGDGDGVGLLVEGNEFTATSVRTAITPIVCRRCGLAIIWSIRQNYLHDNQCQGLFIKDQASRGQQRHRSRTT